MRLENTVFYLLGFPGVGKYTIAQELHRLTGARIVDNHYILNPIFGLIEQDGITPLPPRVWDYAWQVHHAVYGTIRELSPRSWSFIFTNRLLQGDPEAQTLYDDVASVAQARQSLFVPVRLLCDVEELARRITRPQRRERLKTISAEEARESFRKHQIFQPDHPHTLTLDVTNLKPEDSARAILEHTRRLAVD